MNFFLFCLFLSAFLSASSKLVSGVSSSTAEKQRLEQIRICGKSQVSDEPSTTPSELEHESSSLGITIWRSREAKRHEWPWAVSLGTFDFWGRKYTHHCGGALITDRWLITAAKCFNIRDTGKFVAVVGAHNISAHAENEPGKVTMELRKAIYYPQHGESLEHKIVLIQLRKRLKMPFDQPYVWPICLPPQSNISSKDPLIQETGTIYGWGEREPESTNMTDVPYVTELFVTTDRCGMSSHPDMICVDGMAMDFCPGDVGGPMMVKSPTTGQWTMVAVASKFTQGCASEGEISLLIRVGLYVDWIWKTISESP